MKTLLYSAVISLALAFTSANKLIGRWETQPSEKGNVTGVVFKSDNTFEGYINKKPFTSGTYSLQNDTLSFTDNGCQQFKAVYQIILFSNADSLRFKAISDNCTERKEGMLRLILGRVKP